MIDRLDSNRLNELSEYFILDYLRQQGANPNAVVCIDMDGLATDYFGLTICYENFAEEDKSKTAFAPNGITPLKVSRNGKIVSVVFPASCIVLDRYYTLSHSNQRDVIIEYFIREGVHDLGDINEVLYKLDQKIIGR